MTEILDFNTWAQTNEKDLSDGWQEDWNRSRFADMDEYLHFWYARYVRDAQHKLRKRRAA